MPISRSRSLTTLPGDDPHDHDRVFPGGHPNHTLSTSHTNPSVRLSVSSQNLADRTSLSSASLQELAASTVQRSSERRKSQGVKGKQRHHRHLYPPRSPSRSASPAACKPSPCARLDLTLTQDYDPYETPTYYTFHLTLRSPAKVPLRGRSHTPSR